MYGTNQVAVIKMYSSLSIYWYRRKMRYEVHKTLVVRLRMNIKKIYITFIEE